MLPRSTKSEIAARVAKGDVMEVFSHSTMGHFNITAIRQAIDTVPDFKPSRILFSETRMYDGRLCEDAWKHVFSNRDIDMERVAELLPVQIAEPVITLLCPSGTNGPGVTHLLIDGIHRLFRRRQLHKPDYRTYIIPLDMAPRVPEWMITLSGVVDPSSQWGKKEWIDGKLVNLEEK